MCSKATDFERISNPVAFFPLAVSSFHGRGRLVELYKCLSGEEGSRQLDELIADLRHSDIQEMRHFAGTLERWSLEILNSLESIERYYEVQKDGGVSIRDRRIHNGIIERNFMAESATCHG